MLVKRSFVIEYVVAAVIAIVMYLLLRPLVGFIENWFVFGPLFLVLCFHLTHGAFVARPKKDPR